MDHCLLLALSCVIISTSAWSVPQFRPQGSSPHRFSRFAPSPARHHRIPTTISESSPTPAQRPKRDFDDHSHDGISHGHDHGYGRDHDLKGITGPVHTFIKTDKNANYKWGVRHHVGNKYAA